MVDEGCIMHAHTATESPGTRFCALFPPGDCLSCSVSSNLCVSCGPVLRIPQQVNAAKLVCQSEPRGEDYAPHTDSGRR